MSIRQFSLTIAAATIQNLRTTNVTQTTIALAWDAYPGATAYEVRRNGTLVLTTASTTWTNSGHTAGTTYTLAVRPVVGGTGVASAQASIVVTTPTTALPAAFTAVSFNNPPSGTLYVGETGSATIDARDGSPTPYFEHRAGEGWNGGGAARFYAGTGAQTGVYRGLNGLVFPANTPQLNVRYLRKWNSAWSGPLTSYTGSAPAQKGDMFDIGSTRVWEADNHFGGSLGPLPLGCVQVSQSYSGTLYRVHGGALACGAQNSFEQAGCDPNSSKWGTRPFLLGEWVDQWVCFEYELTTAGFWKIYITTQNRAYNGPYMESRNSGSGPIGVTGISGMYFHQQPGAASGAWVMMDELYVAGSYIGPPPGF